MGVSLLELLVVIAVIAVLMSIMFFVFAKAVMMAKSLGEPNPKDPDGPRIAPSSVALNEGEQDGSPEATADWPQFRGPTGQGHGVAQNLPVEFGPGKNLAWKVTVPGKGWSSPVIVKGRVYLTTAITDRANRLAGLTLAALCLEAATGRVIWNHHVFIINGRTPRKHQKNSQASPTPLVAGNRLYVHFGPMGTACLGWMAGSFGGTPRSNIPRCMALGGRRSW